MLRVTSIDEVLSHAARKSRSNPGILGGLAYWIALTRRVVGCRFIGLGGARRQAEMTDEVRLTANGRRADGMVRNARPSIALRHFHLVHFY